VREHRLDLVEIANWEGVGLGFMHASRAPKVVRLSTSSHETHELDGLRPNRWQAWDVRRERWQARAADALVTHSDAHRKLMAAELGLPCDRIHVIPLGIPLDAAFILAPRPPGPLTVVFLGRMEHRKGTVELLQAVPVVLAQVPETRFVLIGADRPHCPGGKTHAAYLRDDFPASVQSHVALLGRLPQPEVDRWLQTADVFVAPSRYESFGLVFVEAMRWGTPVVGTTAGGIPEIVEDGRTGLLVPPESPVDLAATLVRLLADPELRDRLGAQGRRRAETVFSAEQMALRTASLYREVLARQAGSLAEANRDPV
jgi:glycosyltransferase involved in cell wall biosynthesis